MRFWFQSKGNTPAAADSKVLDNPQDTEQKTITGSPLDAAFFGGTPLHGGPGNTAAAYSSSWIAYACIRRLAQSASAVPLVFLSDPNDPDSHVPANHPTRVLFENPSPYFSTSEVLQWLVTFLNMRGECFLEFDNPIRPTVMVPQLDPRYWRDISEGMELEGWVFQQGGTSFKRLPHEVVHHGLVNPNNPFRGQSPLQAAATPFGIEVGADQLTLDVVARGGERSAVFTAGDMTKQQREQALHSLRQRKTGNARVSRDTLLPQTIGVVDPKFLESDESILEAGKIQPDKITSVYGVPKSLLGFEDIDKYATFKERKRMLYDDTIVPMLDGLTSAFDRFFVTGELNKSYQCFVRLDWSQVPAMQDSKEDKFAAAGKAHKDGLPWAVANEAFSLGLDPAEIPGSDTVMVSSTLAPLDKLVDEWETAPPSPSTPAGGADESGKVHEGDVGRAGLTNKIIQKRASNTRENVRRGLALLRLEKAFRKEWKKTLQPYMVKASKRAATLKTPSEVKPALAPIFKGLGIELAKVARPYHEAAALEGQRSIVELVEGKMSDAELSMWRKEFDWSPGVEEFIKERSNLIQDMGPTLFDDVTDNVYDVVESGGEPYEIQHMVRDRFQSAPGGINRAVTIARTEVGTAYSVARFSEMKNQKFTKHTWQTNGDEKVRDEDDDFNHEVCHDQTREIGKKFSCGLEYPMEDGGAAANVINCRCYTIPVIEGI